jgi:hypothetical protein
MFEELARLVRAEHGGREEGQTSVELGVRR